MDNMNCSKFSLFIPAYNAFAYIPHTLNESYRALSERCKEFEIALVDDNSNDQTASLLKNIKQAKYPDAKSIRVIQNSTGPSRRENLAAAFSSARYGTLGFIDIDLSCGMDYLVAALTHLEQKNADIVIGSRYIKGAKVKRELFRRIMSFFYNLTIQILFSSRILDHQCGLKVFRKSTTSHIIQEMGYDHQFRRGWFWDAEFLIRAQAKGLKVIEMPVEWHYARTSTFHFFREWKCIGAVLRLKAEFSPWFRKFLYFTKFDSFF